jgi:23S rRNA (uracil-5-)-methyltransferase RumA
MPSLCPNKEICGSCSWSHIPYEKQLQQKLSDINGSFALKKLEVTCDEIIASPKQDHYRNRMDFVIDFEGRVGMRQKGKWWKVIDNHTCFLADKEIERLFHLVRDWTKTAGLTFFDRKAHTGLLRYAVIRATKRGESLINIVTSAPEDSETVRTALKNLANITQCTTLIWSQNQTTSDVSYGDKLETIMGDGVIHEHIGGRTYQISPNAFFQTNSYGAEELLSTVETYCGNLSEKHLLDLYCGSGFFSIALAPFAKKTSGVELVPEAIVDAKINAQLNQVSVDFYDAKTETFDWKSLGADAVILDPPRSGMHDKALADLINVLPETLVYVSCHYKNFARELVELQKYYEVKNMRAIDLFPHTPHVELVTQLIKRI